MEEKSKNIFYLDRDYTNFIPRKTRLKYSTIGAGWWFVTLMLIFIVVFGFAAITVISLASIKLHDYWQFNLKGAETKATITACESDARFQNPIVTYVYTVDDIVYDAQYEVMTPNVRCGQFSLDTQITIQYQLDNPTNSRLMPQDLNYSSLFAMIIFALANICCMLPFCVIAVLFGIINIVFELKARYQYGLLRQEGIVLDGEVLTASYEYEPQQGRYAEQYILKVTVEFETPDERFLNRTFSKASHEKLFREIPQPGTPVKLLYANDHAVIML